MIKLMAIVPQHVHPAALNPIMSTEGSVGLYSGFILLNRVDTELAIVDVTARPTDVPSCRRDAGQPTETDMGETYPGRNTENTSRKGLRVRWEGRTHLHIGNSVGNVENRKQNDTDKCHGPVADSDLDQREDDTSTLITGQACTLFMRSEDCIPWQM